MNNSCQKTVPGYKNIVNKFMKIRNNTKLSGISKLRKIANIATSDEYKKVQNAFKTKCPAQYKKSQMMLSKFKKVFTKLQPKQNIRLTK